VSTENVGDASSTTSGTWFDTAADALRSGMSDAQQSAEKLWPKVGETLSQGVYNLGYGLGYGVAFPATLAARMVPQENCVVWGLIDGANVAKESANRDRHAT
jgi:hypothetical protein